MESQCVKAESAELMPVNGSLLLRPDSVVAVDEDPVARWVRASTSAQGLPEKVSDPDLLLALVALITRATLDDAALPFQVHGPPSVAEWLVRQPYGDLAAL